MSLAVERHIQMCHCNLDQRVSLNHIIIFVTSFSFNQKLNLSSCFPHFVQFNDKSLMFKVNLVEMIKISIFDFRFIINFVPFSFQNVEMNAI